MIWRQRLEGNAVGSVIRPRWAQEVFVRAFWLAVSESPEWIAEKLDAQLSLLCSAFDANSWQTNGGDSWQGSDQELADIVRRFSDDDDNEPNPTEGYSLTLRGAGPKTAIEVRVSAGCVSAGTQIPRHRLWIGMKEKIEGGMSVDVGDKVSAATAELWRPAALVLDNNSVGKIVRRGGWKIDVGYRTWISSQIGQVTSLAEGLSSVELDGGSLISAPDGWPAAKVASAMVATLAANGLDDVPH